MIITLKGTNYHIIVQVSLITVLIIRQECYSMMYINIHIKFSTWCERLTDEQCSGICTYKCITVNLSICNIYKGCMVYTSIEHEGVARVQGAYIYIYSTARDHVL